MDLKEIRRIVIIALFSDDELMEQFVLKGGNALDLIHRIGTRSSVDVDISMPGDFTDLEDARRRIFRALRERFDAAGFVVFDETFEPKPSQPPQRGRCRPGTVRRNALFGRPLMHTFSRAASHFRARNYSKKTG